MYYLQQCSQIAKLPKTFNMVVLSYVTTYGLTSFFHSLLLQNISSPHQVVSFDESLNNSVQKGQIDLLMRCWDNDTDSVPITWDLNLWGAQPLTTFLRTSRMGFLRLMSQRLYKSLLMDLMLTLHFWKSMPACGRKKVDPLMDLGTCGPHVLHSSLKAGTKASEWELQKLLKAMW